MAPSPVHPACGLKPQSPSTTQPASGHVDVAARQLEDQIQSHANGSTLSKKVYPHQNAFNVIPQVDTFGPNGYTGEETKMMQESRKIMGLPNLKVSATTVRVPVVRAHSIALHAEFE